MSRASMLMGAEYELTRFGFAFTVVQHKGTRLKIATRFGRTASLDPAWVINALGGLRRSEQQTAACLLAEKGVYL